MGIEEFADLMSPEELKMMKDTVMEDLTNLHAKLVDFLPKAKVDPGDTTLVEEIYRAFHSLSGTSGLIQLNNIREISVPAEAAAKSRKLNSEAFSSEELIAFDSAVQKIGQIIEKEKNAE